ncbi:MAG: hypothetical protein ACOH2J_17440 [Allorhizobium sp.]
MRKLFISSEYRIFLDADKGRAHATRSVAFAQQPRSFAAGFSIAHFSTAGGHARRFAIFNTQQGGSHGIDIPLALPDDRHLRALRLSDLIASFPFSIPE